MKLLLTHAAGVQHPLAELARPHLERYACLHGYQLKVAGDEADTDGRPWQWAKIRLLRDALDTAEICLWLDCDVVLRDDHSDVAAGFAAEDFQALCLEQTPHGFGPNTGLWLLRSCAEARDFLDQVWQTGPLPGASLNDQATVAHLLGFSYLPSFTKPVRGSDWLPRTGWLDHRWNMLSIFHPEAPLVARGIHFGGLELEQKQVQMAQQLVRDRLPGWQRCVSPEVAAAIENTDYPHPAADAH